MIHTGEVVRGGHELRVVFEYRPGRKPMKDSFSGLLLHPAEEPGIEVLNVLLAEYDITELIADQIGGIAKELLAVAPKQASGF